MNKKKVLVVFTGSMELGGIERSLLGLLEGFNYETMEVDLFLYGHHGPLFPFIDKRVNLLPEVMELAYLRESLTTKLKNRCYYSAWLRLLDSVKTLFSQPESIRTWAKIVSKCVPKLEKHYDMALGFFLPFDLLHEKVNADVKIGWVHTDYHSDKTNKIILDEQFAKVDRIAAVSEQCRQTFISIFPQLASKTMVIENILSDHFLRSEAEAFSVEQEMKGKVKLLSVGRFCPAKNFDNVPAICRMICEYGIDVTWYLIGYGGGESLIRQKIKEESMEEHVIILGKKNNPYPYMQACDLYVQPSRFEGKCVAVREAQMLGKPVVITDYETSASQLENGVDGLIVALDIQGCAKAIAELLLNPQRMSELSAQCLSRDYTGTSEIDKFEQL